MLLEWGSHVSKKFVSKELSQEIHNQAEPFLKWLKEAEEEESDTDSEDDLEVRMLSVTNISQYWPVSNQYLTIDRLAANAHIMCVIYFESQKNGSFSKF